MPPINIVNFNIVCASLGGFISLFGLVSYLCKEKFYLSEALISTMAGLTLSPHALNWIRPLEYANDNPVDLETVTLYFSRLVLGVQLVLAGIQLPVKYLKTEWKSLFWLLGPGMCIMWICTSLLVWAMVPGVGILFALAVGSCVTPTDPVLSNSIVKGKFADKNIPKVLQDVIVAESGANDGLGYPFLFLALYLVKFTDDHGLGVLGGGGKAIGLWFGITWGYTILLSVLYGAVVGWVAKELLHWAEERKYVDRESFLVFAITLALFIVGTVGMIGSDDVLASFIAGNVFTWDDWFRAETQDDSLQPTIDMLLNVAIFMWYGAVCPWHKFLANDVIPIYRLIPLGIMILIFRRIPMVLAYYKCGLVHQVKDMRQALFTGYFGPMGVSAVFYIYVSREFLREIRVDGQTRPDALHLMEGIDVVCWFMVVCSIVVHGMTVPLGKLGFYLPRTFSRAISSERTSMSQSMSQARQADDEPRLPRPDLPYALKKRQTNSERGLPLAESAPTVSVPRSFAAFGRHIWNDIKALHTHSDHSKDDGEDSNNDVEKGEGTDSSATTPSQSGHGSGTHPEISGPTDARPFGHAVTGSPSNVGAESGVDVRQAAEGRDLGSTPPSPGRPLRSIVFADEARPP